MAKLNHDYDVIIVGGRVAGSTLAAYLGQAGLRVLLVERAELPEVHPASSPMIQPATMAMLDEIGADEAAYARNTPPVKRMIGVDGEIQFELNLPDIAGRNYGYALDRARFDKALWDNAMKFPTVDGKMGFGVTNLLWDSIGKTVIGIEGKTAGKDLQRFTAKCVVGADGRFSLVARKVDAPALDQHEEHPTSLYYGYWRDVVPYDDSQEATSVAYGAPDGSHGFLLMDSADDTTAVVVEGRADVIAPEGGQVEAFYLETLKAQPQVWQRLENASLVTRVRGMRKVGNMFRQAGGNGWALVGDAYHQKDPIDGQGIYDAVYTSRTLAKALIAWHRGDATWDDALEWYDTTVRAKAEPQYEMTLNRVQQSMYPNTRLPLPRKLMELSSRWLSKDRQYMERAGMALNRQVDPRKSLEPRFIAFAMLRGGLRELSDRLG